METNEELRQAWDFVEHTGRSIFLTGKAGTGKTTFLKNVVERSSKRCIVVAPTGVAALNAGGVTIHSFFQLPPAPFVPEAKLSAKYNVNKVKRKIMRSIDLLIIDEISMVRSDLLDAIDQVLRRFRASGRPFGGVQLLMIGDLQQLTPVVSHGEEALLARYYDTPYFFGSHALRRLDYVTIELRHIYRQEDAAFIGILNHIREGKATASDLRLLNSRCDPHFTPHADEGYIRLTTHNYRADNYNKTELSRLRSRPFVYNAEIDGDFPEYAYPTSTSLELKEGAQVMFIKNDPSGERLFYNGRIGRVAELDESTVRVVCPGDEAPIDVKPLTWENDSYTINNDTKEIETEVKGTFRQMPLRLAWAVTIHKSQGLTFEKAIIEVDASFAFGQAYVALSRCKSMAGMVLATPVRPQNIMTDQRVTAYIDSQEAETAHSVSRLPSLKEEYYRSLLTELFNLSGLVKCEKHVCRQFAEFFSNSYPALTEAHKQALASLEGSIAPVADKWTAMISAMSAEDIHGAAFLERVKRSCAFFAEKVSDALRMPLRRTKEVKTGNKQAMTRLENARADMQMEYLTRINLFRSVASHGFTVPLYLKYRQTSTVLAMEGREVKEAEEAECGAESGEEKRHAREGREEGHQHQQPGDNNPEEGT